MIINGQLGGGQTFMYSNWNVYMIMTADFINTVNIKILFAESNTGTVIPSSSSSIPFNMLYPILPILYTIV